MPFFRSDPLWILDRVSLRDLWHTDLARLDGQTALGSPCLHLPMLKLQMFTTFFFNVFTMAFYMGSEDQPQVLVFARQVLCQQSCFFGALAGFLYLTSQSSLKSSLLNSKPQS